MSKLDFIVSDSWAPQKIEEMGSVEQWLRYMSTRFTQSPGLRVKTVTIVANCEMSDTELVQQVSGAFARLERAHLEHVKRVPDTPMRPATIDQIASLASLKDGATLLPALILGVVSDMWRIERSVVGDRAAFDIPISAMPLEEVERILGAPLSEAERHTFQINGITPGGSGG